MPLLSFALPPPLSLSTSHRSSLSSRRPPRMASISQNGSKPVPIDITASPQNSDSSLPSAPEVAAVSAAVCEFMNTEKVRDLANYVVRFGSHFDDLSQLLQVRLTNIDAAGLTADVIAADDSAHCVCVQERLDWPLGLCHNAADVITALKYLSAACGLPADF